MVGYSKLEIDQPITVESHNEFFFLPQNGTTTKIICFSYKFVASRLNTSK
jgi:hypothetical protein